MGAIIALSTKAIIATIVAFATSWRAFLGITLMAALGVLIYNVAVDLMGDVLTWAVGRVAAIDPSELPNGWLTLTSLGAWLAQETYLDQQIGIAVTAISMKWVVVKIPFIKW